MKKAIIGTLFLLSSSQTVVGQSARQLSNAIISLKQQFKSVVVELNDKIEAIECGCDNKELIGKIVNISFIGDNKKKKDSFSLVKIIKYGDKYIYFKDKTGKTTYYNGTYKIQFNK